MDNQQDVDQIIKGLTVENTAGYGLWLLPCKLDKNLSLIINTYSKLPPDAYVEYRKKFNPYNPWPLFTFAERMAILGVREHSIQRIFEGLIALAIEDFRYDYREALLILSLLYHSASKISADPLNLFDKAAMFASRETANRLRDFARHPTPIHQMGYIEAISEDGFKYLRTW